MTGQSKGFNLKTPYQADWYWQKKQTVYLYTNHHINFELPYSFIIVYVCM